MRSTPTWLVSALFVLSLSHGATSVGQESAYEGLEGRWEGAILVEEGRIEIDVTAHFERRGDDAWVARLSFPTMGVEALEVTPTRFGDGGFLLVFDPGDGSGEKQLAGELDAESGDIEGTFSQGLQKVPFYLERDSAPGAEAGLVEVVELPPPGVEELSTRFDRDRGKVRLLLLLSPT